MDQISSNNSIKGLVLKNQEDIAIKAISEKIYTLMQNIRNGSSDIAYQRRWVWELLQNAMDTTNSERDTIVEIEIDDNSNNLAFRHNGNPFKVDNITYLVNQQSSKPRKVNINDRSRTIGKFGTGFITTHLLSEKVTLTSTVDAGEFGHKNFELLLDRSGKDESELYEGVKEAMKVLLELDRLPNVTEYIPFKPNTEFLYHLDSNKLNVAETGLNDLKVCLPFTMAFVGTIKQVRINNSLIYDYLGSEEISEGIHIHKISITNAEKYRQILTVESKTQDAIIAFEIEKNGNCIKFIETSKECPKLFCNYPFIGTEEFNTPFVSNSSSFNIYQERRNGIILKDADTLEIQENKSLVIECKNLFFQLLQFLDSDDYQFDNTYLLADFQQPKEYEWLSKKWYDANVLKPAHNALLGAKIVEIEKDGKIERTSIANGEVFIDFPFHKDEKVREEIYNLCNMGSYFLLPLKEQIHHWHSINWWEEKYDLSIKNLTNWVASFGNTTDIQDTLGLNSSGFTKWMEDFYSLVNKDENIINLINQNKLKIFPNQNGILCTKNRLFNDAGDINTELKDILQILGEDCRATLLETSVFISGAIAIDNEKTRNAKFIANQIKDRVAKQNAEKIKGVQLTSEIKSAFGRLYTWFVDNSKEADLLFGDLYQNKEHRLCDERDIAKSMAESIKLSSILSKYGVPDIDALDEILAKEPRKEKSQINPDHLIISLGITSPEELERAKQENLGNKQISEALNHISSADLDKFQKVIAIISRSVANVKKHLEGLEEYNCSGWKQESITTVSGILKNGRETNLVIRPADGGQIIIFYPKEFTALDNSNTELWYDNEVEQKIYSFGRFLKRAKVNRLPV